MKAKSKEKNRNAKPNEKKVNPADIIDKLKQESPSTSTNEWKKENSKNLHLQNTEESEELKVKNSKLKSKSSCVLETIDRALGNRTGETSEASESRTSKKREASLSNDKEVTEKIKKNKSLDHVGKLIFQNVSRTTLAKKVSNVLTQDKNLKRFPSDEISSNLNRTFPNVLEKYSSRLNIFNCSQSATLQNSNNGQMMAGKSVSYDSVKVMNKSRALPKCLSVENGKNMKAEKPIGVFNVHKKSYSQTSEACTRKVNVPQTIVINKTFPNRCLRTLEKSLTIPETLKHKQYQGSCPEISSDCINLEHQDSKGGDQNDYCCSESKPVRDGFETKKPNDLNASAEKKSVKICQCLHFHTEDGFKKLLLQNNTSTKEYGQKFFRVNYFSKEDKEELESQTNLVCKQTENKLIGVDSDDFEKPRLSASKCKRHQKPPLNKKIIKKLKTISNNSLKSNGKKLERTKRKEGNDDVKYVLRRNQNQLQVLGQSKLRKKDSGSQKYAENTEKNTKRHTELERRERKKSEKLLKTVDIWKENAVTHKTLEELEVLEKLFLKLNSVENALIRRKTTRKMEKRSLENRKIEKKEITNSSEETSLVFMEDKAEERFLRLRNKLRNAIIRHVQNFFKLDVTDN